MNTRHMLRRTLLALTCLSAFSPVMAQPATSASDCSGNNLLFYNAKTGEGAIGTLSETGVHITSSYLPGSFAPDWGIVAMRGSPGNLVFYRPATGEGASAVLDHGRFETTATYNHFAHDWTHIVPVPGVDGNVLFYNASTGEGSLGYAPTQRVYVPGSFASGWTHIVNTRSGELLFYKRHTGEGAVAVVANSTGQAPGMDDLKTIRLYKPHTFSTQWSHIAAPTGSVVFYDQDSGAAAIGHVDSTQGFAFDTVFAAGHFRRNWTHVIASRDLVLFYDQASGAGAVGVVANGHYRTTWEYPDGSFPTGWTHVVCASDVP